jgi:hypothetical protein
VSLLGGLLTIVVGCGPDYKARAVVKGKVTSGKQALTTGTVTFYGPHDIISSAPINEDGTYEMNDAPIGECKVTVKVNPVPGSGFGPKTAKGSWEKAAGGLVSKDPTGENPGIAIMGKIPAKVVKIQDKFANPDSSGLTYKVEKGEHVYNIDL